MASLKASPPGLASIKQARSKQGWTIQDTGWLIEASCILEPETSWPIQTDNGELYAAGVSLATWRRFLEGKVPIQTRVFKAFC